MSSLQCGICSQTQYGDGCLFSTLSNQLPLRCGSVAEGSQPCQWAGSPSLPGPGPWKSESPRGVSVLHFQAARALRSNSGVPSRNYFSKRSWCGLPRNVNGPAQWRACKKDAAICYFCCFNALWYLSEPRGCTQGKEQGVWKDVGKAQPCSYITLPKSSMTESLCG